MLDTQFNNLHTGRNGRGIVTVAIDTPGRRYNVLDESLLTEFESLVAMFERDVDTRVVAFTSAKESGFLAGADVRQIADLQTARQAMDISDRGQRLFDRIERLPIPTVAVIHGPCLGGGLEFALACRHRVARDDCSTRLGLPEVRLGLLPAWGGTQRLPELVGVVAALPMILQGKKVSARQAAAMGLVDAAFPHARFDREVERFVSQLSAQSHPGLSRRRVRRPLLRRGVNNTRLGRWFVFRAAKRRIRDRKKHYPAAAAALDAVECGAQRSREEGLLREGQSIGRLLFTRTCRNLLELFFQRERARRGDTWVGGDGAPSPPDQQAIGRVGVVGAGVMGAGIAQLAAYRGFQVVLKDVDDAAVATGMNRIRKLLDGSVAKGRLPENEAAARLQAVMPTIDWRSLEDVDLVIEAVVERQVVKRQVFEELQRRLKPAAILATNTSSLSVEQLGRTMRCPARIAGLHFFNPVHRMELVEVVRTHETSDETVRRLVRFVRRLGKTPIVVNDSPGFLVNRILFPYLGEAVRMVYEGVAVETVDREMREFGMPMGPLELLDRIGLDVAAHVATAMSPVLCDPGPVASRLTEMVDRGWLGEKSARGFYRYRHGRRGRPNRWDPEEIGTRTPPALALADDDAAARLTDVQRRLVYQLINEASRCLGEGVVAEPWIVDLAMVLATGFAPFRGGPLRLADELGVDRVVSELRGLRHSEGERFTPSATLRSMGELGDRFYPVSSTREGSKDAARRWINAVD